MRGKLPSPKPAPQAACGRPLRELSAVAPILSNPKPSTGLILAHNSLIVKEQPPNASGGRQTGHDLSARKGAAGQTMIGSRATGV